MKEEKFVEDQEAFEADGENVDFNEFITGGKFLKNPKIGESVEFTIKSIVKKPSKVVVNPKTKKKMNIGLSGITYYYEFNTIKDEVYSPMAWEVVGKIKAIGKKLGHLENVALKITHIRDGREESDEDAYKVEAMVDGSWKQLDRETLEWKQNGINK